MNIFRSKIFQLRETSFFQKNKIKDSELALNDIMDREKYLSTGLENGLAVPHGERFGGNGTPQHSVHLHGRSITPNGRLLSRGV